MTDQNIKISKFHINRINNFYKSPIFSVIEILAQSIDRRNWYIFVTVKTKFSIPVENFIRFSINDISENDIQKVAVTEFINTLPKLNNSILAEAPIAGCA